MIIEHWFAERQHAGMSQIAFGRTGEQQRVPSLHEDLDRSGVPIHCPPFAEFVRAARLVGARVREVTLVASWDQLHGGTASAPARPERLHGDSG